MRSKIWYCTGEVSWNSINQDCRVLRQKPSAQALAALPL